MISRLAPTWNYYSRLSRTAKAAMWFTACNVIQKGIAFITIPIFTRIMTVNEYGLYSVYQSYLNIVTVFATLNLTDGVFNTAMIKYPSQRSEFISSMQGLSTLCCFILLLGYFALHTVLAGYLDLKPVFLYLMMVQLIFTSSINLWTARQRFDNEYKRMVAVTLGIALFNALLGILFVKLAVGASQSLAIVLSIVLVQAGIGGWLFASLLKSGKILFSGKYWKYALAFNLPLIPHYVSLSVLSASDKILVSRYCGSDVAAIYSVAYSISMVLTIVKNSINQAFIPWLFRSVSRHAYGEIRKYANLIMVVNVAISIVFILLGPEIIQVVGSSRYQAAVWVIPPVAASSFFMFLYNLFANIEFYFEQNKFVTVASVLSAALNILLNIILIPKYGFVAAGYTTLICYAALSLVHYLFMRRVVRKRIGAVSLYDMRMIGGASAAMLALIAVSIILYHYPILRWIVNIGIVALLAVKFKTIAAAFSVLLRKEPAHADEP